jgi:pimeloyl-ACP methyl ester carboxylesterase
MTKFKTTKVEINGINLNILDEGQGPAVLLLHGFPDSHHLWRKQIPALLAEGYRVIAPDLRGFGLSDAPIGVENYSPEELMKDVICLLDYLHLEKVNLIAHDFGAILGWNLSIHHPERFVQYTALSVGHPHSYLNLGGYQQSMKGWYTKLFRVKGLSEKALTGNNLRMLRLMTDDHPETNYWKNDLLREGRSTAGLNWYRAYFEWSKHQNFSEQIVNIPVMGIWSSKDIALSRQQMVNSCRFLSEPFHYKEIEGASHWMQVDKPEELNQILIARLAVFNMPQKLSQVS